MEVGTARSRLVLARPRGRIDHEHFHRTAPRLEFQAQLLFERRKNGGAIGAGRRVVGNVLQAQVELPTNAVSSMSGYPSFASSTETK